MTLVDTGAETMTGGRIKRDSPRPLMVAECLAGRVPVLASRMGGIAESVRDEVDGLLVDGRDAPALAAALDRLSSEPDLLERYYAGERASRSTGRTLPISVSWRGDQGKPTSLSVINTNVCNELAAEGFAVERMLRHGWAAGAIAPFAAELTARHQWPPDFSAASDRLAVIHPWEFGSIPQAWVGPIQRNVDELWVPSEYVKRMYVQDGIDPARIQVIGNGVDLDTRRTGRGWSRHPARRAGNGRRPRMARSRPRAARRVASSATADARRAPARRRRAQPTRQPGRTAAAP